MSMRCAGCAEPWTESAMSEPCRFDQKRPYACQTHNTQWLDDDADQCEYKRMVVAEAATSAVREACDEALHEDPMPEGDFRRGYNMAMKVVLSLLDAP